MKKALSCFTRMNYPKVGRVGQSGATTFAPFIFLSQRDLEQSGASGAGVLKRESGKKGLTHFVYIRLKKWGKVKDDIFCFTRMNYPKVGQVGQSGATTFAPFISLYQRDLEQSGASGAGVLKRESDKKGLTHFVYNKSNERGNYHDAYRRR